MHLSRKRAAGGNEMRVRGGLMGSRWGQRYVQALQ